MMKHKAKWNFISNNKTKTVKMLNDTFHLKRFIHSIRDKSTSPPPKLLSRSGNYFKIGVNYQLNSLNLYYDSQ